MVFFIKPSIFPKNPNFERFDSCHSSRILRQICYFYRFLKNSRFFSKNLFFKKTQILNILRNLTILVTFYSNFATIWRKKMTFRHVNNRCWLVYASSIGKHRVKKTHFHRTILLSLFSTWRKITSIWNWSDVRSILRKREEVNTKK